MSKIYEALQKAERERERKAGPQNIEAEKKITAAEKPAVTVEKPSIIPKPPTVEKSADYPIMPPTKLDAIAAEEFRKLRTMILHTSVSKPMQSILVTSALPGEGKTTVASNLALVISQGVKEHALLIDCDLRNSSVLPFIGQNKPSGLSDYLMGKLEPSSLIMKTGAPKLSIVPSGSITSKPAELVGSERMRNLITALKSQFANRYIIIDSCPIMLTTEPIILSEMVDGVILVVLAGKTAREVVQRALTSLNKEKILGIVLNQIDTKSSSYHYHSKYYHHYYHYPGKKG